MTAQDRRTIDEAATVVSLSGELDVADTSWSDAIDSALDQGERRIVVDLLNVTFADSSVIRALVLAHRRVVDGGWVRIVYTHHVIRRVIDICGLTDLLPQFTTVDAALRGAPTRHLPDGARNGDQQDSHHDTDRGPTS